MPDRNTPTDDDAAGVKVQVSIPPNADLWVGIEEQEGCAPTSIVGGNPNGLRMLAAFCAALADSGVAKGQLPLTAGAELLEGSEADLLLAIQPEDVTTAVDRPEAAGACDAGAHERPGVSVVTTP